MFKLNSTNHFSNILVTYFILPKFLKFCNHFIIMLFKFFKKLLFFYFCKKMDHFFIVFLYYFWVYFTMFSPVNDDLLHTNALKFFWYNN